MASREEFEMSEEQHLKDILSPEPGNPDGLLGYPGEDTHGYPHDTLNDPLPVLLINVDFEVADWEHENG